MATIPALGPPQALIAVASDGAGSACHSDEGARAACNAFLEFSRLALGWVCCAEYLTDSFGAEALTDLQRDIGTLAKDQDQPIAAFACTLLGALVTPDAALFVQIGDGAIVYRIVSEARWRLAARAQRGEFANETVFTTRGDASKYLQAIRVNEPISDLALMTDGVEFLAVKQPQGEPHATFFEYISDGLRNIGEPGEVHKHSNWLESFLNSDAVNQRTDDDKTLIIATRARWPAFR